MFLGVYASRLPLVELPYAASTSLASKLHASYAYAASLIMQAGDSLTFMQMLVVTIRL